MITKLLTILIVLFASLFSFSNSVLAAEKDPLPKGPATGSGTGTTTPASCCEAGYTPAGQRCLNNEMLRGCNNLANFYCVLDPTDNTCETVALSACLGAYGAVGDTFELGVFCQYVNRRLCANNPNSIPCRANTAICTDVMAPFMLLVDPVKQPQCSGGSVCGNSGMCVEQSTFELCSQIGDPGMRGDCEACAEKADNPQGIWTAVGCIDKDPQNIISKLIQIGLGMGGGVALLMILAASFMLTTSQGDPKRTGEAKEMVTAAIIGLVFVIFSVTILQFIGFTILRIPGFGGS